MSAYIHKKVFSYQMSGLIRCTSDTKLKIKRERWKSQRRGVKSRRWAVYRLSLFETKLMFFPLLIGVAGGGVHVATSSVCAAIISLATFLRLKKYHCVVFQIIWFSLLAHMSQIEARSRNESLQSRAARASSWPSSGMFPSSSDMASMSSESIAVSASASRFPSRSSTR